MEVYMSREVVKYHNDFNQVYLGKLNAAELDLAFDIIAKVKDKGTAPIYFSAEDLKKSLQKNYSQHEFSNLIASLRRKFFKLDFTVITKYADGSEDEDLYNLFKRLTIHRAPETKEVTGVTIEVEEFFKYLVNNVKLSFTRFELEEFLQIRGAYAKKLFRLLKQFRTTGIMTMSWADFADQMGIPNNYTQADVNKRILWPAVQELAEERTVAGKTRPTFKDLSFTKLSSPGSRKITAIRFEFETEGRVLPKAPKAQQTCPFAEGTAMWYVWHHKEIPDNLL